MDTIEHLHIRVFPGGRLNRRDAATYLGRAAATLENWASSGRGPKPVKIGGRAFYNLADLDEFIAADGLAAGPMVHSQAPVGS